MAGQPDGKGVAILLLLIALFMILYILLLPPEQREDILNQSVSNGVSEENVQTKVLFIETPGEIYPTKEDTVVHEMSPANIFIKSDPKTSILADSLEISKSLISNKPQTLTFDVEDISNLKDILLFFSVADTKGKLIVKINDHQIFDGEIGNVETIKLPINYINKKNKLELKASSPGIFIFSRNHHSLEEIGIKETYQLTNPKEERIFSIPKYEASSMQKAVLSYQIYCNKLEKNTTPFKIFVNDNLVLDKLLPCMGSTESLEIDKSKLKEGTNDLEFNIGEGDFQLSKIELRTELKEKQYPTYHFEIQNDDYKFVEQNKADINLRLEMNEEGRKISRVILNNKEIVVDTENELFTRDVSSFVNEGENIIKIIPQNTFSIDKLELKLEEN